MSLIAGYLFSSLITATLFISFALSVAVWLTQSLRFLEVIVKGGAPFSVFLHLVVLTLPGFVAVILPIALFVCVLYVYNRLLRDSELIAMQASGLSQWQLAKPALYMGVLISIVVLALNSFIAPASQQEMKKLENLIRTEYSSALLREGVFNSLKGGITVYVRERTKDGEMRGILIQDDSKSAKPVTVIAQKGVLIEGPNGPRAIVFNGNRQEVDPQTGQLNWLEFDRYDFDLQALDKSIQPRLREASERNIFELMRPTRHPYDQQHRQQFLAEAHNRLASPWLALSFAMIAVIALLYGDFDRHGGKKRLFLSSILAIILQSLVLVFANMSRKDSLFIPLIYIFAIAPGLIGVFWLKPWQSGQQLISADSLSSQHEKNAED